MKKLRIKVTSTDLTGELTIEYGDKSESGFLPGFDLYLSLATISILAVVVQRKNSKH